MNKIVLASKSPRRSEILGKFVENLIIDSLEIDEKINLDFSPQVNVMSLSLEKASGISKVYPEDIVIGSDTIVYYDGNILGKPIDYEDAFKMLRLLSGKTHSVYSGYAILKSSDNRKVVGYEETKVKFKELTDETIEDYLNTEEYKGKAGAYAIQGYGAVLVENITGTYENIVGLPISSIDRDLNRIFDYSLLKGNK